MDVPAVDSQEPLVVRFGEPLDHETLFAGASDRRARLERATRILMDRIAALGGVSSREAELDEVRSVAVPRA